MVLAVPPSHRFASREAVAVGELAGESLVGFDPDLSIRRAIDRFLRRYEVHVKVALEFDNIENIKRAAEIPAGLAILPEPTLAREVESGTLAAVRIEGQDPRHRLTRPLAVIHRRNHQLSLTAARFLKLLTDEGGEAAAAAPVAAADGSPAVRGPGRAKP